MCDLSWKSTLLKLVNANLYFGLTCLIGFFSSLMIIFFSLHHKESILKFFSRLEVLEISGFYYLYHSLKWEVAVPSLPSPSNKVKENCEKKEANQQTSACFGVFFG